jgi:hypothetical protein
MSGQDDAERARQRFPAPGGGPAPGDDILEHGNNRPPVPRWLLPALRWPATLRRPGDLRWPSRPAAVLLLVAGLVAGLAAGYAAGDRHAGRSAAPLGSIAASQAAEFAAGGSALGQSGPTCAAQVNGQLQLGMQVTNVSQANMALRWIRAVLPIGGLTAVAQTWEPCGTLPLTGDTTPPALSPGASIWFTVTFKVLIRCPEALPVQFTLGYVQSGRRGFVHLQGFSDLGQVPYSGCR